ncbi:MAG: CbiX/SirB N-terminal domain-containing protein [Chthonomonadetes bacterium]|nr:CbiX/SirB N-terminal domain-containing protein [Chthonomonadetes bacterium]
MSKITYVCASALLLVMVLSAIAKDQKQSVQTATPGQERTVLVIVEHGTPASDFPREKLQTLIRLERQVEAAGGEEKAPAELVSQLHQLERECRLHPRTPQNDPYNASVERIAQIIARQNRFYRVLVAHNEFCGLDVDEAIEQAVQQGATRVLVVTTMVTPGGGHSERDIPEKIERARKSHPQVKIQYIWPVSEDAIAKLFLQEIDRHTKLLTTTR